jgi:NAD(P)-dependent dehydrogenase (short-subunit alcohol dehydrogenase family)
MVDSPDFPSGCAVVFGGSGGLGGTTALALAAQGTNVVVTFRSRPEEAGHVVEQVERVGRRAIALQCDVRSRDGPRAVIARAQDEFGRVHSVISAQGARFPTGPLAEAEEAELRAKLETDVFGFLNIARATVFAMRSNGGGAITAVVSPAVHRTIPNYGLGVLPKAGVAMMVRYLAVDEGQFNIRVNAVAPGVINAGMANTLRKESARSKKIIEATLASTPLRRMGEAREVADVVAFLSSNKASYITGQIIMVDGGYSL